MNDQMLFDVFLSHSEKDKNVVRVVAERLRADGLRVWFDEWMLKPGDSIPAKIEEGLEHSRVLVLCMSAHAFGSDWAQLESGMFRFRDPLNKERRFLPLRLDDTPIKGTLAQLSYINWLSVDRELEYAKLLEACQMSSKPREMLANKGTTGEAIRHVAHIVQTRLSEWKRVQNDFEAEAKKYHDVKMSIYISRQEDLPAGDKFPVPNYSINLWQYFGSTDCEKAMGYLRSATLTNFGMSGAEITALGLISGEQTEFFCKMALRAGTLLPDEISHIIVGDIPNKFEDALGTGKPLLIANNNPLAKWLNMMLVATVNSHPGRFMNGVLTVDPFAASLSIFDYFSTHFLIENSATNLINQQIRPPSLNPIGDAWSGVRGVLQQAYSTKVIKGILGQSGLAFSKVRYAGSYKGPFLDEVDRLVNALDDDSRDRFVVSCIQEVITLERGKYAEAANGSESSRDETLQRLQLVLSRFGYDVKTFESV